MKFLFARFLQTLSLCFLVGIFANCGYQIGVTRPQPLVGVETLHIALPENMTQFPGLEAHLANHLVDAALQEGSYQVVRQAQAQVILRTTIRSVDYEKIRSSRTDALRPEELRMNLKIDWEVVRASRAEKTLYSGETVGATRFFLDENLQASQDNALPDALSRGALRIIQKISDSY